MEIKQKTTGQSRCLPWRRSKIFQSLVPVAGWPADCWPNRHVEPTHALLCWSATREPVTIHNTYIYMTDEQTKPNRKNICRNG